MRVLQVCPITLGSVSCERVSRREWWQRRFSPAMWEQERISREKVLQYLNPFKVRVAEYGDGTFQARITQSSDVIVPLRRGQMRGDEVIPCTHRDDTDGVCKYGSLMRMSQGGTVLVPADLRKRAQRCEEGVARARRQVRSYVRNNQLTRLLTFTNGDMDGGFDSAEDAYAAFAMWWRVHGKKLLPKGGCVVVAEQGSENGRWHLHALVRKDGWFSYNRVRESWSGLLQRRGYRSATGVHRFHAGDESGRAKRGFKSARVAAAYASKYLGKSMRSGRRRFRTYECARPLTSSFRVESVDSALAFLYDRFGDRIHYMQWVKSPDGFPRALVIDGDVLTM